MVAFRGGGRGGVRWRGVTRGERGQGTMVKPIARIHEDTLILKMLELAGVVNKRKIAQARKIVRGFSDYKKLTGKRKPKARTP